MRLVAAAVGILVALTAALHAEQPFVPVFREDFADPFILPTDGGFLAYATNPIRGGVNVQIARSPNLVDWDLVRDNGEPRDALPVLPAWARQGDTWAPEVIRTAAGYVLYFTAKERESGLQCIGAAFSADPLGPFTSDAKEPLVCQRELGGTIDPDPFRDADGQFYLYYKNDGNRVRQPTTIFVQRMAADGLHLSGEPVALLRNDAKWEGLVIEAPTMVHHDGRYILFFSGNFFGWDGGLSPYAMGYATCDGPMGPCTQSAANPILHSYHDLEAGCLSGPGHQAVFIVGGRSFIAFHAWGTTGDCRNAHRGRYLYVAPLGWKGGAPQIGVSLRRPDDNR
jgi:beta-xylosidase